MAYAGSPIFAKMVYWKGKSKGLYHSERGIRRALRSCKVSISIATGAGGQFFLASQF
jgi:hypothetical protein